MPTALARRSDDNYFGDGGTCDGIVAFKYAASEAICMSESGPPCDVANAAMSVPGLPKPIQVRQKSSLVGTVSACKFGTMLARCSASWQTAQMESKRSLPYLP